jgi:hypothetical protein
MIATMAGPFGSAASCRGALRHCDGVRESETLESCLPASTDSKKQSPTSLLFLATLKRLGSLAGPTPPGRLVSDRNSNCLQNFASIDFVQRSILRIVAAIVYVQPSGLAPVMFARMTDWKQLAYLYM